MAIRRVNRTTLDGTTVAIKFGRYEIPCLSASYGDSLETDIIRAMGSQSQDARSAGTYKTEDAKIKLEAVEFRSKMQPLLASNGFGNVPFPISVTYSHPDLGTDHDVLEGCRIVGVTESAENSNKPLEVELTVAFIQLKVGAEGRTLNWANNRAAFGSMKF